MGYFWSGREVDCMIVGNNMRLNPECSMEVEWDMEVGKVATTVTLRRQLSL